MSSNFNESNFQFEPKLLASLESGNCNSDEKSKLFDNLFTEKVTIKSYVWRKQNVYAGEIGCSRLIQISQWASRKIGNENSTYTKRVVVDENLNVKVYTTDNLLDLEKF